MRPGWMRALHANKTPPMFYVATCASRLLPALLQSALQPTASQVLTLGVTTWIFVLGRLAPAGQFGSQESLIARLCGTGSLRDVRLMNKSSSFRTFCTDTRPPLAPHCVCTDITHPPHGVTASSLDLNVYRALSPPLLVLHISMATKAAISKRSQAVATAAACKLPSTTCSRLFPIVSSAPALPPRASGAALPDDHNAPSLPKLAIGQPEEIGMIMTRH